MSDPLVYVSNTLQNIWINYQPELVRDFFNQDGKKTKHARDKQIRDDLVALKPETVESYATIY